MNPTAPDTRIRRTPLLEVDGIDLSFSGFQVLNQVRFTVPEATLTAIVGPNGAGKTTMLHAIAGMCRPDRGRIVIDGKDVTRMRSYRRARHGVIRTFQIPAEFSGLTVLENLLVADRTIPGGTLAGTFLRRRRTWSTAERTAVERARTLLDEFGLAAKEDEYARDLSGGQRKIVELLRAVVADPRLLLLDEPFAGVHASIIDRMSLYLSELRARGVTLLMIAHELDAVERLCDSVVVMARGSVLFEGTMGEARCDQRVVDAYVAG